MGARAGVALLAVAIVTGVAGCGDPNGPASARAAQGPAPAQAAPSTPTRAPRASAAPETPAREEPSRRFAHLATAPLEEVVMTLRADPDAAARRHAADVYVQRVAQGASPEPLLEACATDLDPLVRRWAALGLAASPSAALAPRLGALAASEPDATVRSILSRAAREAERKAGRR